MSMSPNLTTEPTFTPRKEFIRIPLPVPDFFALLVVSSSNCIRLYLFPASVIDALRRLFEQLSTILSTREDSSQGLYEFALDGKPWANAKSVSTEKLLLDILTVIYQYGYNYLSTIDYGRENDDRLAMVFSKPGTPSLPKSLTTNPLPPSMPANFILNDTEKVQRVPFALSFASATLMRVIAPPLHLTPAILQAVRASWPRGVVSEKKVGDNSFEFRLKGYRWFQQDTFATDSLRHILALLTALGSHSFSLLTSISLTNRSKLKDLWIFTGPVPESFLPVEVPEHPIPEHSLPNATLPVMRRFPLQPSSNHPVGAQQQHKRFATDPTAHLVPSPQHSRSTTDCPQQYPVSQPPQRHLLRKPAPRAQVPVSVIGDSDIPDVHHHVLRVHMPSTISAGVDNMTGVGAVGLKQDALSTTSPLGTPSPIVGGPATNGRSNLRLGTDRTAMPPLLTLTFPNRTPQSNAKNEKSIPSTNNFSSSPFGMNGFRDFAFSSNTATPITRTGLYKEDTKFEQGKAEAETEFSISMSQEKGTVSTPIHENNCRIDVPAMITPDMSFRKSEAALLGIVASTSHVPPILHADESWMRESQNSFGNRGQGWVLVNVEDTARPVLGSEFTGRGAATSRSLESNLPLSTTSSGFKSPAAAKAIVVIDTMDSRQIKRSTMQPKESGEGSQGLKRFFSLNKKNLDDPMAAVKSVPRSSLRDRLRLMGTRQLRRSREEEEEILYNDNMFSECQR